MFGKSSSQLVFKRLKLCYYCGFSDWPYVKAEIFYVFYLAAPSQIVIDLCIDFSAVILA
jgi:hypothetical protein